MLDGRKTWRTRVAFALFFIGFRLDPNIAYVLSPGYVRERDKRGHVPVERIY